MRKIFLSFLLFLSYCSYAQLDNAVNFGKATVSSVYSSGATSIVLNTGNGAKLPQTTPYNLVWWDSTVYNDPSDDPSVEIVRVTTITGDTLTITRGQEGTTAVGHNTTGHVYKVIRTITAKEWNTDIPGLVSSATSWTSGSGGALTLTGPTISRVMTAPDAAFTVARTDAGQTFTGVDVFTSPSLLGTVSVADSTTPAISLAAGKTNTGTITINGKTSGSTVFTTADATAQAVTHNTAAQTVGASVITIPDLKGVSGTFVTGPSAGAVLIAGPTAARTLTIPDATSTMARTDAGQTFTGVQIMTSPSLLGTVSVADTTTPAISLASGKTNTGTITINGKTSGSTIFTTADATAQNVTITTAAQTSGASTITFPDNAGTSYTVVRSPNAGPIIFSGSTASRTKTIRDAADTILELGGSYSPTGTWTSLTMVTPVLGTVTSGNVSACTDSPAITTVPTMIGGWNQFKVSGSDATTTGQTLVDITGLVTGTLSISSSYEYEAVLYCTTTAVTTGTEYGVNVSVSPTNIVADYIGPTTVAANVQTMQVSGTNANHIASAAFLTTASEDGCIFIKGFFTTAGSGSPVFSIQHLKVTSGTSTVKIGSVLRIRKL